jgi:hypothetical protein
MEWKELIFRKYSQQDVAATAMFSRRRLIPDFNDLSDTLRRNNGYFRRGVPLNSTVRLYRPNWKWNCHPPFCPKLSVSKP